jgi:hypothetical protein
VNLLEWWRSRTFHIDWWRALLRDEASRDAYFECRSRGPPRKQARRRHQDVAYDNSWPGCFYASSHQDPLSLRSSTVNDCANLYSSRRLHHSRYCNKMAATAKYQDVPQRDSFEGAGYSQPPPSYQAEPVPGDARSEDDNVPDDFKVCGPCSSSHLWQEANIL